MPTEVALIHPPVPGQLVALRNQRYLVTGVEASSLPPTDLAAMLGAPSHAVSLLCLDEDAQGEELEVLWELEPGAMVMERTSLPQPGRYDSPTQLDALLDAVTWGAIASADTRQLTAPFRSAITLEDYQLEPLARALQKPRVSLLLADDVGLGKTIEAGLIAQELILRNRVRNLLIVCPADLQVQWQDQMQAKFGLHCEIINRDKLADLRRTRGIHVNPWSHYPRLITSLDYLKRDRPMRLLRDLLPKPGEPMLPRKFDLLILDEAHNVAPSGRQHYATDSQNTRTIREIARHFENRLFLTATPHNGFGESFTALMEILDPQRFIRGVEVDRKKVGEVTVRRLKSDPGIATDRDGKVRFPRRNLMSIAVEFTEAERQAHAWLQEYAQEHLAEATAKDGARRIAAAFFAKFLKKRLFSSPAAFARSLETYLNTLQRSTKPGGRRRIQEKLLQRQVEALNSAEAGEEQFQDQVDEVMELAASTFDQLEARPQRLLADLRRWAQAASQRPDSKAQKLIDWLTNICCPGGRWTDERVLIFTEYRDTQEWLHGLLAAAGLAGQDRLMLLYGGMAPDKREEIKARFQAPVSADNPVRILLATDAASEGIDLQNHCSRLVHYEIPWNPNRMEQRNGRIDRHGQPAEVVTLAHFVPAGFTADDVRGRVPGELEGDLEFLARAILKVDQIRTDLGSVGPVIAQQVEEAMYGTRRTLDTAASDKRSSAAGQILKFDRDLRRDIAAFMADYEETRDKLHLTPDRIERLVTTGLRLSRQPALIPTNAPGVFRLPIFQGAWKEVREGVVRKYGPDHTEREVVFDQSLAIDAHGQVRADRLWLHLGHPLVQRCLRILRADLWAQDAASSKLARVSARIIPASLSKDLIVIANGRLLLLGGDGSRLHEEVIASGLRWDGARTDRLGVKETESLLAGATMDEPTEAVREALTSLWTRIGSPMQTALESRAKDRGESLIKTLQERAAREAEDMRTVFAELAAAIRRELAGRDKDGQLTLNWDADEKAQWEYDRKAWEQRLDALPEEERQELDRLAKRYDDPQRRLFPATVSFLVPDTMRPSDLGGAA